MARKSSISKLYEKLEIPEPPEQNFSSQLLRIFQVSKSVSDKDLADKLQIKPASVAGVKKREKIPMEWFNKISSKYDVDIDWLMYGSGSLSTKLSDDICPSEIAPHLENKNLIPLTDVQWRYKFNRDFLKNVIRVNAEKCFLFCAINDDMAPDINKGDFVLIDTSVNHPIVGKIIAISVHDLVLLCKAEVCADGYIFIFNKNRDKISATPSAINDSINILGQVVWKCSIL